ncbi:MAG: hypothetical protein RIR70_1984, partial [Pseudomonadota bacterium]
QLNMPTSPMGVAAEASQLGKAAVGGRAGEGSAVVAQFAGLLQNTRDAWDSAKSYLTLPNQTSMLLNGLEELNFAGDKAHLSKEAKAGKDKREQALKRATYATLDPEAVEDFAADQASVALSSRLEQAKRQAGLYKNLATLTPIGDLRKKFEERTGQSKSEMADRATAVLKAISGDKDALQVVSDMEADPFLQFLILREAQFQAASSRPDLEGKIDVAIGLLFDPNIGAPNRIKADLASTSEIAHATQDLGLRKQMRESYRDALPSSSNAAELVLHLLENYPEHDIPKAMGTLAKILSQDARSPLSSRSPAKLHAIMTNLQSIRTIMSTIDGAKKMLAAVVRGGGVAKRTAVRIATDLIRLANLRPSERFVTDVLLAHVEGEDKVKQAWVSYAASLFNNLPESVWPEEDAKTAWRECLSAYLERVAPRDMKAV